MTHPYRSLPDRNFWRRSVSAVEAHRVDPVGDVRFKLTEHQSVGTAGSCFAQHIARVLRQSGYRYLVAEVAPDGMEQSMIKAKNYGVFSARFGNIYTARQLLQLLQEAYGLRTPQNIIWARPDGRFVDALRPTIDPEGYVTPEAVFADRETLLACVREMVAGMDVFMFTLGLTEAWMSREDGTVYPVAPGASAGSFDARNHIFHNFCVAEVMEDMTTALYLIKEKNPNLKVVLTVSPVPLIATYEPRHVLTSTVYSKSVLRVAAQMMYDTFDWVEYFPSYEVITSTSKTNEYYELDRREVSSVGVARAMSLFKAHYLEGSVAEPASVDLTFTTAADRDMICDEEMLDVVKPTE